MSEPSARPVTPRPAATVMVVRAAPAAGCEVYMVRRHQAMKFAADQYVFPGGTIRDDDVLSDAEANEIGLDREAARSVLRTHGDPFSDNADGGLSLWVAALRETFEEAGVLLALDFEGKSLDLLEPVRREAFEAHRKELQAGGLSLLGLARRYGLRLMGDHLHYFSRWITPSGSPRRFDARFFVAELPEGQSAEHCQIESVDGLWVTPAEALERNGGGDFPMMFVTSEHVRRLAEFDDAEHLLGYARQRVSRVIQAEVDESGVRFLTPEMKGRW